MITTKIETSVQWKRRVQNPFQHLRWSFLGKNLTAFRHYIFSQKAPSQMLHRVLKKLLNGDLSKVIVTCIAMFPYSITSANVMKCEMWEMSEAAAQRCSVKNVFLEISQDSKENTCARVSFLKRDSSTSVFLWILRQLYLKRDSGTGVFLGILQNL